MQTIIEVTRYCLVPACQNLANLRHRNSCFVLQTVGFVLCTRRECSLSTWKETFIENGILDVSWGKVNCCFTLGKGTNNMQATSLMEKVKAK